MLRGSRPLLLGIPARGLRSKAASASPKATFSRRNAPLSSIHPTRSPVVSPSRQLIPHIQRALYASKVPPPGQDKDLEKKVSKEKLKSDPSHVSTESSVRHAFEPGQGRAQSPDMTNSLTDDLKNMREAFALKNVPTLSLQLGLAGTLPYLATSLATVFLCWNLNTEWPSQSQLLNHFLMSHESAAHYLHQLEPIQVGYGAVIISFLGAIHWGLEYAEKNPGQARTTFRYGLGVLAPALAWPTVALPVQFALTAQFAAFTFMYFADARATARGWAPAWYGTYRFVLTFIVCGSLLLSLVGREKVGEDQPRLTGLRVKFHKEGHDEMKQHDWEKLEAEEKARIKKEKAEAEKKKEEEKKSKEGKGQEGKGGQKKDEGSEGSKSDGEDQEESKDDDGGDEGGDEKKDEGSDDDKKDEGGNEDAKKGDGDEDNKGDDKKGDEKKSDEKKGDESGDKKDKKKKSK